VFDHLGHTNSSIQVRSDLNDHAKNGTPRLLAEVISPGDEDSENYQRDYVQKPHQYAAIGVLEIGLSTPIGLG
jgi:Uma2 family endonuclease